MPISQTITGIRSGALTIVEGTPRSLFKLAIAACTPWDANADATKSFVVVLPTLPVTPTTACGALSSVDRNQRASAPNASVVDVTAIAVSES